MYVAQVLARPKPPEAQVQTVWAKTVQEATEGTRVMEGPYTKSQIDELHGVGSWRRVVRFATQERSGKYRVIDNGRAGSQNDVTGAEERIHTCSSAASAAIARRFRGLLGTSLQGDMALRSSTEDMKSAFRQLPVHPESLRFTIITVWHPEWNTWSFWRLFGMPFGLKGAVLDFNRVSAALLALARRWLAIPSLSFFDDFRTVEMLASCPSADDSFRELVDFLEFRLDPKRRQHPAPSIIFLGTLEVAQDQGDPDSYGLLPKPERVQNLVSDVVQSWRRTSLPRMNLLR